MRKIIPLAFILVLATATLSPAATSTAPRKAHWVSGEVVSIENGILSLKEPNGEIFKVSAKESQLKKVHIGDMVSVKDVDGWAAIIKEMPKRATSESTK